MWEGERERERKLDRKSEREGRGRERKINKINKIKWKKNLEK